MFLKISEAYSVLGAEQSRRDYDRTLLRSGGGPNRRAGLHTSRSSVHRYASSSAFSSSGEYSSAKRSDNTTGYRRPNSTYTRYAGTGGTFVKSNFEEWERKHYWELKQSAQHIDGHVRESAKQNKYSNWQISIYQLWEALTVFTIVFAVGWGGRYFIYYSAGTNGSETVVVRNGQKPSHKDE
ncbi:hypothetical protein EV175_001835 [Coemansia sp. RSA 1933]|nr:hypothetical protein EV175_001835 [Coemansia sp. RSA 1933]